MPHVCLCLVQDRDRLGWACQSWWTTIDWTGIRSCLYGIVVGAIVFLFIKILEKVSFLCSYSKEISRIEMLMI